VPAAFLLLFLVYPLATLVARVGTSVRLAPGTTQVLVLSTAQASASTLLALAVGVPLAAAVTRYRFRGRALAQALLTVPFVLPTVVVALAFRTMLGATLPQGLALVILAHAYVNLAVVVRVVGSTWVQFDDGYEKVARSLGAGPWRTFVSVTLPSLRGSIVASAAIVFTFSFTSLGIALLLGDSTTRTLESQVLRQAGMLLDFPGAATTAFLQLLVVVAVLAAGGLLSVRSPRRPLRPARLLALPRHGWAIPALAGVGSAIVLAPVATLLIASVRSTQGWTLSWWSSLGSVDAGTDRIGSPVAALATSLAYAGITAVVAALVGGCAAVAVLVRGRTRVIALVAMAPLGISAATVGLGTLLAFGRPPVDLRGTGLLVPLTHALVAIPLVVAVAAPALRAADPRRALVAASLGAAPTRAFLAAYGPVLRVVSLSAAGLAAAVSLGEFGAASFLARSGAPTVPLQIARLLGRPGEQAYGVAAALAVLLVAMTLTLTLVVDRAGRSQ
jgi:thiamine transport system permease protein